MWFKKNKKKQDVMPFKKKKKSFKKFSVTDRYTINDWCEYVSTVSTKIVLRTRVVIPSHMTT